LIQTLTRNWWLLALCGLLDAIISLVYLVMRQMGGGPVLHSWNVAVVFLGKVAMAGGACTVAAGILRSRTGKCWPLVLNGLALGALGLIQYGFVRFRISLLTVSLLIVLMAMSIGILELALARNLRRRRHVAGGWYLGSAGAVSVGFALAFLALGFEWIKTDATHVDLLWLSSYFGFSAICTVGLALGLRGQIFRNPA